MALQNIRAVEDGRLEGIQGVGALAGQGHFDKHVGRPADSFLIDQGNVTLDYTIGLQSTHPPETGRR